MSSNTINEIVVMSHDDSAIKDFEIARANVITTVEIATEAIQTFSQICDQSQNPRAYEVLAKLVDSGVAASKSLLDLQSKIRELKQIDEPLNENARSITNNLFVGSTKELQQIIKDMRNNGSD